MLLEYIFRKVKTPISVPIQISYTDNEILATRSTTFLSYPQTHGSFKFVLCGQQHMDYKS